MTDPAAWVERETAAIVEAAKSASLPYGRPCLLRRKNAVRSMLHARVSGGSLTVAARKAGVSKSALKRWRRWGLDGKAPFWRFAVALAEADIVLAEQRAKRLRIRFGLEQPQVAVSGVRMTPQNPLAASENVDTADAIPDAEADERRAEINVAPPTALQRQRWQRQLWSLEGVIARGKTDPAPVAFARQMLATVTAEIAAAGSTVDEIRSVAHLPQPERERLYVVWCGLTGRMGPTDSTLQRDAASWALLP
jgi:hypothetical protein